TVEDCIQNTTINNTTAICSLPLSTSLKFSDILSALVILFGFLAAYIFLFSYLSSKSSVLYLDFTEKSVSIFFYLEIIFVMFIGILVTLHSSFFGLPSTISGGNPLEIYIDSVFFVIWIVFTILFIWFRGIIVSNHQEIINFNREKNHIFGILINASSVYFFLIAFVVIIIFLNLKFSIFTLIFIELLILQFHWINSAISNLPYKQVNI